jgi:four helix bundle protein
MTITREKLFRFEDMDVWQRASDLSFEIDGAADELERQRRYKYAEQLRSAGLSISNNIAEGSGCNSNAEFCKFLGYARRSAFESASMLLMFERRRLLQSEFVRKLTLELHEVCRMIVGFSRSLG